jgi:hypothetical protein
MMAISNVGVSIMADHAKQVVLRSFSRNTLNPCHICLS